MNKKENFFHIACFGMLEYFKPQTEKSWCGNYGKLRKIQYSHGNSEGAIRNEHKIKRGRIERNRELRLEWKMKSET